MEAPRALARRQPYSSSDMTNLPSFDISGRVAVVTGGYGVLGGTVATGLAAAGAHVVVIGRDRAKCEAKSAELSAAGGTADFLVADVLDDASIRSAASELMKR